MYVCISFVLQVIRELDSSHQLKNVNKLKIVQYQYKPEYLNNRRNLKPEDEQGKIICRNLQEIEFAHCSTQYKLIKSSTQKISTVNL